MLARPNLWGVSERPPSPERADHWDAAYEARGATGVSWFEPTARTSIALIERLGTPKTAAIIEVGGGASVMADTLLDQGFTDVTELDVSTAALTEVGHRVGARASITLLQRDVLAWQPERKFDLWHDRAGFHFLVDASDRVTSLRTLRSALRPAGMVIMATIARSGPEYCSGLPVSRYSTSELTRLLGPRFQVVEVFEAPHVTPGGVEQPFAWVAAKHLSSDRPEDR
jgi:Methyltransferase domain